MKTIISSQNYRMVKNFSIFFNIISFALFIALGFIFKSWGIAVLFLFGYIITILPFIIFILFMVPKMQLICDEHSIKLKYKKDIVRNFLKTDITKIEEQYLNHGRGYFDIFNIITNKDKLTIYTYRPWFSPFIDKKKYLPTTETSYSISKRAKEEKWFSINKKDIPKLKKCIGIK